MFFQVAKRGENEWWQYVLTLFVVLFMWQIIGAIPLMLGVFEAIGDENEAMESLEEFSKNMDFSVIGLDPTIGLILLILSFGFGILGLWLMMRFVHKRSFSTLITPIHSINYKKIFTAAALWFLFMGSFEVIAYFIEPENYIFQFEASSFLPLVLICFFLLPLQTSFEELLMRGYLLQGTGLATHSKMLALIFTSVIFGLMHSFNPEVAEYGYGIMMVNYISIGLMLGIMTIMDDGLELAIGVHWANNFYGATMVTFSSSALQTPALFKIKELDVELMTIAVVVFAIIFLILLSKLYNWGSWSKLLEKISDEVV